jgi:hypothetical protein
MKRKAATAIKVVIDRIEEGVAVIVLYDDDSVRFNLPVKYLPGGARAGDHFEIGFKRDDSGRDSEREKIDDLLGELTGKKKSDKQ